MKAKVYKCYEIVILDDDDNTIKSEYFYHDNVGGRGFQEAKKYAQELLKEYENDN